MLKSHISILLLVSESWDYASGDYHTILCEVPDFLSVSYSQQQNLQKEQNIILFSNQEMVVEILQILFCWAR